jgi:hypothetical protein
VVQRSGFYPRECRHGRVAGGVAGRWCGAAETVRVAGLDRALTASLARWRTPTATHDPAKVVLDQMDVPLLFQIVTRRAS